MFEGDTWERYEALRIQDGRLHRNLCRILNDMQRCDLEQGLGKPEPLRHSLSGLWSRRVPHRDRLID